MAEARYAWSTHMLVALIAGLGHNFSLIKYDTATIISVSFDVSFSRFNYRGWTDRACNEADTHADESEAVRKWKTKSGEGGAGGGGTASAEY